MEYLKIDNDSWIQFDRQSGTAKVISISALETEKTELQQNIDATPEVPPDTELLDYGRQHYPYSVNCNKRLNWQSRINEIDCLIDEINTIAH